MASDTLILPGTRKGALVLELDARRERVAIRGPYCEAMPIQHLAWDLAQDALLAAAGSPWYGAIVWRSLDLGQTWSPSGTGLSDGDGPDDPAVTRVWSLTPAGDITWLASSVPSPLATRACGTACVPLDRACAST